MGVEVTELVWQDVGVRDEVKVHLPEFVLHLYHVSTESILPGDLVTLWKVVDLLVLVQAVVQVTLARTGTPQDVPLVALRVGEPVGLQH